MFLRGFASDGEQISEFFKLQKICTDKNIILDFLITKNLIIKSFLADKTKPVSAGEKLYN